MKNGTRTTEEKQLTLMRIQTGLLVGILILIALFVIFVLLAVQDGMDLLHQLDMGQLNAAVTSLKTAADKLSAVDIQSLNSAIGDLSMAAEDLSTLDFEKLAGFMDSLETMGKQMDAVSGFFQGFLKK